MASETTVYVAVELSVSSWLVATRSAGAEKSRLHRIRGVSVVGLNSLD